jgi:hypothetical protein
MVDKNVLEKFTDDELKTFMKKRKARDIVISSDEIVSMVIQLKDKSNILNQRTLELSGPQSLNVHDLINAIFDFLWGIKIDPDPDNSI